MIAEISYDLIMEDNMSFVEGCYRLPGHDWEVFTTIRTEDEKFGYKFVSWSSGVTGINIFVPREITLNTTRIEQMLSKILDVDRWIVVRGPDSIVIR
jgi:hypothetical protein